MLLKISLFTMPKKLSLVIGTQGTVKMRYFHPAKLVSDNIINSIVHTEVSPLLIIREENRKVNKKDQTVIVFQHDTFETAEIYGVKRFAKVLVEGGEEHF